MDRNLHAGRAANNGKLLVIPKSNLFDVQSLCKLVLEGLAERGAKCKMAGIVNGYGHLQGGIKSGGSAEDYPPNLSPEDFLLRRTRLGLSQNQAAQGAGIKQQQISQIETGETSWRAPSARRLDAWMKSLERSRGKVRGAHAVGDEKAPDAIDIDEPGPREPGGGDEGAPPSGRRRRHAQTHLSDSIHQLTAIDPKTGYVGVTVEDPAGHAVSFVVTCAEDVERWLKFFRAVQAMAPAEK